MDLGVPGGPWGWAPASAGGEEAPCFPRLEGREGSPEPVGDLSSLHLPWRRKRRGLTEEGASVGDVGSVLDGQLGPARVWRAVIPFYRWAFPQPEPCVESERELPLNLDPSALSGKSPALGCISLTHTCTGTCTRTYTHTRVCTRACVHIYVHVHTCAQYMPTCMCALMHPHVHGRTHVHPYVYSCL